MCGYCRVYYYARKDLIFEPLNPVSELKEYSEHNSRLARRYNGQPSRLGSICEEEMCVVAIGEFPQQLVPV